MGIYYYLNEGFQKIIIYFLLEKLVVFLVLQMSGNKCNEDSEKCSFYFFSLRAKTLVFCAYNADKNLHSFSPSETVCVV